MYVCVHVSKKAAKKAPHQALFPRELSRDTKPVEQGGELKGGGEGGRAVDVRDEKGVGNMHLQARNKTRAFLRAGMYWYARCIIG